MQSEFGRKGISLQENIIINPDVAFRDMDGEAVILNLSTGIYFGLNKTGTKVWLLLSQYGSLEKVLNAMALDYDVSLESLERDLLDLVGQLREKGLVTVGAD